MTEKVIPKTIQKAVDMLLEKLDQQTLIYIKSLKVDDLSELHCTLGTQVRNSFGLWGDNKELLGDCKRSLNYPEYMDVHADTASSMIIEKLWKRLDEKVI